jgi:hypothetical protein
MTRTFLLFYIFTVPFALLSDVSSPIVHLVVIFFLTYGFCGLEIVAMEVSGWTLSVALSSCLVDALAATLKLVAFTLVRFCASHYSWTTHLEVSA